MCIDRAPVHPGLVMGLATGPGKRKTPPSPAGAKLSRCDSPKVVSAESPAGIATAVVIHISASACRRRRWRRQHIGGPANGAGCGANCTANDRADGTRRPVASRRTSRLAGCRAGDGVRVRPDDRLPGSTRVRVSWRTDVLGHRLSGDARHQGGNRKHREPDLHHRLPRNLRMCGSLTPNHHARKRDGRGYGTASLLLPPPTWTERHSTKKVTARQIQQKLVCARVLVLGWCVKGRPGEKSVGWGSGAERVGRGELDGRAA